MNEPVASVLVAVYGSVVGGPTHRRGMSGMALAVGDDGHASVAMGQLAGDEPGCGGATDSRLRDPEELLGNGAIQWEVDVTLLEMEAGEALLDLRWVQTRTTATELPERVERP